MATVHPDARMQLLTGEICPVFTEDLFIYRFVSGFIVCREEPAYDVAQRANDHGAELAELMDPSADPKTVLRIPRSIFEAWLLEEGKPFGVVRDAVYPRAPIAAVWGRILPSGNGPATLRLCAHSTGQQILGVEDRLGQAVACFLPYPSGDLASEVPNLEDLMKKRLDA